MRGTNVSEFEQLDETILQQKQAASHKIEPKPIEIEKIVYRERLVDKSDQMIQTVAIQSQLEQKKQVSVKMCQTEDEKKEMRNLSPFETYDLLFIRDLVNNLNFDNEILNDNSSDLKTAFMFLFNEHKQL